MHCGILRGVLEVHYGLSWIVTDENWVTNCREIEIFVWGSGVTK